MEVDLQDTFLREEDQQSQHSSKQTYSVPNKRKNEKVQEEKVATEQQAKEEKEQAENIASMLIRNYDNKLYGEDDTSQPTSRTAPIIPLEATRKKKKRRRSQISICLTNCRYESIRKVASAFGMREVSEEDA
ncbi:tubulin polyglutamylase TTLL13-like [Spodoptera litura]|nr:tubulin polyglutamylase TTLL13-like [Spodoptera litura]